MNIRNLSWNQCQTVYFYNMREIDKLWQKRRITYRGTLLAQIENDIQKLCKEVFQIVTIHPHLEDVYKRKCIPSLKK